MHYALELEELVHCMGKYVAWACARAYCNSRSHCLT